MKRYKYKKNNIFSIGNFQYDARHFLTIYFPICVNIFNITFKVNGIILHSNLNCELEDQQLGLLLNKFNNFRKLKLLIKQKRKQA